MALGRAAKHEGQADLDNPVQSIRLKALFNIVDSCLIFLMCFIVWDRYQILNGYSCKPETWRTLLELSKVAAEKSRQSNQLVLAGLWYDCLYIPDTSIPTTTTITRHIFF